MTTATVAAPSSQLISLAKTAKISLAKAGVDGTKAKVAFVLDISASMRDQYASGQVQALTERVMALAVNLDDDQEIDVFTFGRDAHFEGTVKVSEINGYVNKLLGRRPLEGDTKYGAAIAAVRHHYFGHANARSSQLTAAQPVFVLFITDGQCSDEGQATAQVRWASQEPMFIQFMGIGRASKKYQGDAVEEPTTPAAEKPGFFKKLFGGATSAPLELAADSQFPYLERLDELGSRHIDNCGFFAVKDPVGIAESRFYDLIMKEYPSWRKAAISKGMLPAQAN